MNNGKVIGWTLFGLLVLGVVGFFCVRSIVRANKVKPFKQHIDAYAQPAKNEGPGKGDPQALLGKVNGKVITVDLEKKEIDYLYFDLPNDLRAETPEDVGTVAQLQWGKHQLTDRQYTNGKPAFKQNCVVTLVDKATGNLIARQELWGGDPPSSIKSSQSEGTGSKPEKEVVDYLKGLPRK